MAPSDFVDIWSVRLDRPDALFRRLETALSADERQRASRFVLDRDRRRFVERRAALRTILGSYLALSPADVVLVRDAKGKPLLAASNGAPSLCFNTSHSAHWAVVAVAHNRAVGVDVEKIRRLPDIYSVAQRFFSPGEIAVLDRLDGHERLVAFFNCWTRKEAYIKARGEGLSMPLDAFDVSLAPGEPAALLRNHVDETDVARWEMRSIPVAAGYVAAMVVEGHEWKLKTFSLEPPAFDA